MKTKLTELIKRALDLTTCRKAGVSIPPGWMEGGPAFDAVKPATCYLIFSEDLPIVSVEDAVKFNENHLGQVQIEFGAKCLPPFMLPETIKKGVKIARADYLGDGKIEAVIADRTFILLPGGKVIGPPQVSGWRPRTKASNWGRDFDPLQELYDRKE